MSKRIHPIYKLQRALNNRLLGDIGTSKERALMLRHIKPLLDELDVEHSIRGGHVDPRDGCPVCRLLAEWRKPL